MAIQGLGQVGFALAGMLAGEGGRLIVADLDADRVARAIDAFGGLPASTDEVHRIDADVFSLCALGAIINDGSVSDLGCAIVAGSDNNQLAEDRHGEALRRRGILYAPDCVINAGGVISAAMERFGEGAASETAYRLVRGIGGSLAEIFTLPKPPASPAT